MACTRAGRLAEQIEATGEDNGSGSAELRVERSELIDPDWTTGEEYKSASENGEDSGTVTEMMEI